MLLDVFVDARAAQLVVLRLVLARQLAEHAAVALDAAAAVTVLGRVLDAWPAKVVVDVVAALGVTVAALCRRRGGGGRKKKKKGKKKKRRGGGGKKKRKKKKGKKKKRRRKKKKKKKKRKKKKKEGEGG